MQKFIKENQMLRPLIIFYTGYRKDINDLVNWCKENRAEGVSLHEPLTDAEAGELRIRLLRNSSDRGIVILKKEYGVGYDLKFSQTATVLIAHMEDE